MVHSRPEMEAPRSFWIDGRATFTTVLSSMIMNSAKHIAPSVHQRLLSSVISRWRWARMRPVTGSDSFRSADGHVVALEELGERPGEQLARVVIQAVCELLQAVQ